MLNARCSVAHALGVAPVRSRINAIAEVQIAALRPGPCPHVQRWPSARSAHRCIRSRSNFAVTSTYCLRNDIAVQNRRAYTAYEESSGSDFAQRSRNGEQRFKERSIFLSSTRDACLLVPIRFTSPPFTCPFNTKARNINQPSR
jgi:hypothetical protein